MKLADFGNAKEIDENVPSTAYQVTRFYRAPELLTGNTRYGTAVDVWAAGCVVGELIRGRVLLQGADADDQLRRIVDLLGPPIASQWRQLLPRGIHVSDSSMVRRFGGRPNGPPAPTMSKRQQVGRHEMKDLPATAQDLLLSLLLVYEPSRRARAAVACDHDYFSDLRRSGVRLPDGQPLPLSAGQFELGVQGQSRDANTTATADDRRRHRDIYFP